MADLSILIAARDEAARLPATIARLQQQFPGAPILVGDDGSRDDTAAAARAAGATVLAGPRLGKGEALNAAEQAARPGPLLICDADLAGDLTSLAATGADLAIAVFTRRQGGGFGLAKAAGRELIRLRTGRSLREPLSGQRYLSERARAATFPVARGFGCEVRMTIDALRAGLVVHEVELPLEHRATGRDLAGFAHRGRQLVEAVLAAGPVAENIRGNRLPIVGLLVAAGGAGAPRRLGMAVGAVAVVGLIDDLYSGPERGWRAHVRARRTTGVMKLTAIPLLGLAATGSLPGALAFALGANALNQLDTAPGRALKGFALGLLATPGEGLDGYAAIAVLLLPYDLRERVMLGDAGSNALGAVVGLRSVARRSSPGRWTAVALLAGLNALGELTSLSRVISGTPVLRELDALGRLRP